MPPKKRTAAAVPPTTGSDNDAPPPPKRARGKKATATAKDDAQNEQPVPAPAPPRRGRSALKGAEVETLDLTGDQPDVLAAVQAMDVDEVDEEVKPELKKRARATKKAADAVPDDEKPAAKGKGKKKADEPAPADDDEPVTKAKGKGKGKKKADEPVAAVDGKPVKDTKTDKKDSQASIPKKVWTAPVDDHCSNWGTYTVYVGDDGTVWDASLNQTNVSGNNNKFYRIQLLESKVSKSYDVWTRWGRVGESGQSAMLKTGSIDAAMKLFDKKFKDKSGLKFADRFNSPRPNKYTFVERNYEPDNSDVEPSTEDPKTELELDAARTPESKLAKPVQQLMELIFNPFYMNSVMQDLNYDARKLPLGKLSKRTLERGYLCLKELAALILTPDPALTVMEVNGQKNDLTNAYYSTIPHDFGRSRPRIIADADILKREIALLESLSDMKVAEEIMKEAKSKQAGPVVNPLDRQFEGLGLSEMTPLDPTSQEFKELQDYLVHTRASTHALRYEVEEIFRIERNGEFARFDKSPYGSLAADRRLLWHGSRTTNFGGILSQGLRIAPPEAPVSGYMYGKGVYMADMSSKSANYCFHQQSGGVGLLLLCEAELGKPLFELTNADYDAGEKAQKAGCLTTLGRGQAGPAKWKDAGCVHPTLEGTTMPDVSDPPASLTDGYLQYNEYIVYDVEQIRLRYLFRVKMEYSWGN